MEAVQAERAKWDVGGVGSDLKKSEYMLDDAVEFESHFLFEDLPEKVVEEAAEAIYEWKADPDEFPKTIIIFDNNDQKLGAFRVELEFTPNFLATSIP